MVTVDLLVPLDAACYLGDYGTAAEAVAAVQEAWMEEPEGPQAFLVRDKDTPLAMMVRDNSDPEVCHTLWATGHCESHRCRYILRGDGVYSHTQITSWPQRPIGYATHATPAGWDHV